MKKKQLLIAVIAVATILVVIVALRGFSGEDDWICKDGQWQKHGNPSGDMPSTTCSIE